MIYFKDWIKKFQIVQKQFDLIKLSFVLNDEKSESDMKEIVDKTKIVMGQDCKVEFEFVDDIELTKSGKYLYTLSEVE